MAAQVDICLPFNAFLSRIQYGAWTLAQVCSMKVLSTFSITEQLVVD